MPAEISIPVEIGRNESKFFSRRNKRISLPVCTWNDIYNCRLKTLGTTYPNQNFVFIILVTNKVLRVFLILVMNQTKK